MFDHVYSEPHPVMREQREWLAGYEHSFGPTTGDASTADIDGGRA